MNKVSHFITDVLSEPYERTYGDEDEVHWWHVDVEYNCHGSKGEATLSFDTREEAEEVEGGDKFLA